MAAIADLSDLINRATGGNNGTPQGVFGFKVPRIAGAVAPAPTVGRFMSLWRYEGGPSAGNVPTTAAVPTNTTTGALPFTNPGGSRESWLIQFAAWAHQPGTIVLYDRLLHSGGLSGTNTTAQTVGGTLTRNTNGVGNLIIAEIYTQIGATATTITASYTDQDGNTGQTTTAVTIGGTGFRDASRAIVLPLASDDTGVQAVASITLAGTTGTAGDFGITIAKPIAYVSIGAIGTAGWRDFVTGLPTIPNLATNSCLALGWMPQTTTAPEMFYSYSIIEA